MKNKCAYCKENIEFDNKVGNVEVLVRGVSVVVEQNQPECPVCKEYYYDRNIEIDNQKKAFNAYKAKIGLLTSEEIIQIRQKYGLSQSTFSKLLGFGLKTIARYENGAIQDKSNDVLIRLINDPKNFIEVLNRNKDLLLPGEIKRIENKIKLNSVGINVEQHSKLNEKRSSIVYSYVTKEVDKYSRDVEEKIKIELNLNKQEYSYVWNVREKEYNTYDKVQ